jgi:hypothetical protein
VEFSGEMVEAIRVKAPAVAKPAPPPVREPGEDDSDF